MSLRHSHSGLGLLLIGALATLVPCLESTARGDDASGAQIWSARCANCHGERGEGKAKRTRPLEGEKSLAQLADVIRETMPEDDPGSLTVAEARRVAEFVNDAFYSKSAREKNRPAQIELARLTARQHRLALTDLVGSFRGTPWWGKERGLWAMYFAGRYLGGDGKLVKRNDPEVNFHFGTEAPVPELGEPHEFAIRWGGSFLAPDTGEYEFVVETEHATRLFINDEQRPLIDAWVKSGTDTQYRAPIFLTGGRIYPLRLEFTKGKQGVDDSKDQKEKPPSLPASIVLHWKRPGRTLEVVPTRALSLSGAPEAFVCTVPFPPDDRSYGWVRGTAVSKEWDEATTAAALQTTEYLAGHLREFAGNDAGEIDPEKLRNFCRTLADRAFRRPITDELAQILIDRPLASVPDKEVAFRRVCLRILKSPRFLYREIDPTGDAWDVASRLAFGLWDSLPDEELRHAAAKGKLATDDEVRYHAGRMLADQRARSKLRDFLLTWLKVDASPDLAKSAEKFPGFDAAVISDLRTSLELFLDDIFLSEGGDFRRLLLSDRMFLNRRLAALYGFRVPENDAFTAVSFEPGRRAGVLTHPYLMAAFAGHTESSPIHRGVFLARGLLGQNLKPPPEAVSPLAPDLHPDLTTRERVILQTQPAACMTCHGIINPLGFTLEQFDAIGRYRETDRGKSIDATGQYRSRDGNAITIHGARPLAEFLAGSEDTQRAFTEQLLHHLVQQSASAYRPEKIKSLRDTFVSENYDIRHLAVEVMVATAPIGRKTQAETRAGRSH